MASRTSVAVPAWLPARFLLILPICGALLAASSATPSIYWRLFSVGLCFGIAGTIKLQALIGLPCVIIFLLAQMHERARLDFRSMARATLIAGLGVALPLVVMVVALWYMGALADFLEIASNYWPLYGSLTGTHVTIVNGERPAYLLQGYWSYLSHFWLLLPAVVGCLVALWPGILLPRQRREIYLLIGMALIYGIYPGISGQFWAYHWLILSYFATQLVSLCFVEGRSARPIGWSLLPVIVALAAMVMSIQLPVETSTQLARQEVPGPKDGRVDEIAGYLQSHLREGDTVQPLDWTGGALHAMLIAQAPIATRFIYDFHFYHHISTPYNRQLREEFMTELAARPPRFIIEINTNKPWVSGTDTTERIPRATRDDQP